MGTRSLLIALVFTTAIAGASPYVPLDDRAYRDIESLRARGHAVVPAATLRPYTAKHIAVGAYHLTLHPELSDYEREMAGRLLARFERHLPDSLRTHPNTTKSYLVADVNPRLIAQTDQIRNDIPRTLRLPATWRDQSDQVRSINTLTVDAAVSDNVSVQVRLEADTDGVQDNDYNGRLKTYRLGMTGYLPSTYVSWENEWAVVAFGRQPLIWGPGRHGSTHLSENAPAIDMLSLRVDAWKWFHFSWFTGELSGVVDGMYFEGGRRYIAGHRMALTPTHWLEIGAGEVAHTSKAGWGFSFWQSNPVGVLMVEEVNRGPGDSNILLSCDITVRPIHGVETYAEWTVDDYSLDKKVPHFLAWTVGGQWEAPLGWDRFGIGAEYSRVMRWTYNYYTDSPYQKHVNVRAVMGHFIGSDSDLLTVDATWEARSGYRFTGITTLRRLGETRTATPFPVRTSGIPFGYHTEPFPSGTVERTITSGMLAESPPFYGAYVTVGAFIQSFDNFGNVVGASKTAYHIRFGLDWHIPVRFPG